jgi:hypothetical protein
LQQLLALPGESFTQRLIQSWVNDGHLFAHGGV